jgi:phenylacetate-CoA ligase
MGRADQTTKVKGMFVHPSQVADIGRAHPELGKLRLVVGRSNEQDTLLLQAECSNPADGLAVAVAQTMQKICKIRGQVELVGVGSLENDGKVISDDRPAAA